MTLLVPHGGPEIGMDVPVNTAIREAYTGVGVIPLAGVPGTCKIDAPVRHILGTGYIAIDKA